MIHSPGLQRKDHTLESVMCLPPTILTLAMITGICVCSVCSVGVTVCVCVGYQWM